MAKTVEIFFSKNSTDICLTDNLQKKDSFVLTFDLIDNQVTEKLLSLYNNKTSSNLHYNIEEKDTDSKPSLFSVVGDDNIHPEDYLKLDVSEYELCRPAYPAYTNAVLFLDSSTVGRSLEGCYYANDLVTIRDRDVIQKEYITGILNYEFNCLEQEDGVSWENCNRINRNNFRQWCEENDVGDYYDYWLPKYNLGKIPIGTCRNISDYDEYKRMITDYPYMIGIRVK